MSTAARKARKRSAEPWLIKKPKVGTPVEERIENRPRQVKAFGAYLRPGRFGLTSRAASRLEARGLSTVVERPEAPKLSKAERAEVRRFGLDKPE